MSELEQESAGIIRELLHGAIPVNPQSGDGFITRVEFEARIEDVKTKIDNASLRQKIWVMGAALAIIATFGGGYVSLVTKLNAVADALPPMAAKQEQRGPWIARVDQRDARQDEELRKLDQQYQPLPYIDSPQ